MGIIWFCCTTIGVSTTNKTSTRFQVKKWVYVISTGIHGAVVWGTALQTGRSRFWFPKSFRPQYGPGVDSAPKQKWVPGIFPGGVKAACEGWHPYHLHVLTVLKSESLNLLEPSGPVQAGNGIALTSFYLISIVCHKSSYSLIPCNSRSLLQSSAGSELPLLTSGAKVVIS